MIKFLQARFKRWLQTVVWGMDIHPSARIAKSALIDRTWPRGIHIAQDCVIDEEAVVLTHDMTRGIYMDTRIGAKAVVGARSIIMPGVTVGEGCVIAPGAVVTKDVPPRSSRFAIRPRSRHNQPIIPRVQQGLATSA